MWNQGGAYVAAKMEAANISVTPEVNLPVERDPLSLEQVWKLRP